MNSTAKLETSGETLSSLNFHILTWVFAAICIVAFAIRAYIRFTCFRRLWFEDYLILLAMILQISDAILIQLFIPFVYDLEAVQNGDTSKIGPDFLSIAAKGFKSVGCGVILTIVGVLLIKLNFLLFFRRLGTNVHRFLILWWTVLLFTVAGTLSQIGSMMFGCFFGDISYILGQCAGPENNRRVMINGIYSSVVDGLSDFLIIALPLAILWRSHLEMRKKIILLGIFGLVFITIAVTIVRGSIFHTTYNSTVSASGVQQFQSLTFTWFWFYCEFTVAFLIACIVSFRSLFVRSRTKADEALRERQRLESARRNAINKGWKLKLRNFHESVLETCRTLEGWPGSEDDLLTMRTLPHVPSGLLTVNFNDDSNWSKSVKDRDNVDPSMTHISVEHSVSVRSLPRSPEASHY